MTFCVAPWYALEQGYDGHQTACCLLPADVDIQKVRQSMLDGQQPEECQACWRLEAAGHTSDRQRRNQELDVYWDVDISEIERQVRHGDYTVRMLKLFSSNLCNSTCATCGPAFSSSWQSLTARHDPKFVIRPYTRVDIDQINCDLTELRTLSLLGGEPLYESNNFRLLERLVELGNTDLFVSIVTNGSVQLNNDQKKILSLFPRLNICLSIDGVGEVFEYIRAPLQWSQLLDNLKFFRTITGNISASYTISNLNILYHLDNVRWFQDNQIPYNYNPVRWPEHFAPEVVTRVLREHLKSLLPSTDFDSLIGSGGEDRVPAFLDAVKQLDQQRGTDWTQSLPRLARLYTLNF